jgi:hypothetical protein
VALFIVIREQLAKGPPVLLLEQLGSPPFSATIEVVVAADGVWEGPQALWESSIVVDQTSEEAAFGRLKSGARQRFTSEEGFRFPKQEASFRTNLTFQVILADLAVGHPFCRHYCC